MASLGMGLSLAAGRGHDGIGKVGGRGRRPGVAVALATKGAAAGAKEEEKGLLDWILGGLQKDEQLLETDPILNKVQADAKAPSSLKSNPPAPKTNAGGGFGGLFAKK